MPFKNRHPLFSAWANMIQRCHVPTHKAFKDYGARGIHGCERWRASFGAFCEDMGERPAGLSLDRINNDGNYEPGNCRWATWTQQQRNRSNNKLTEKAARTIAALVAEEGANKEHIAREFGVSRTLVRKIADGRVWR